MEGFPAMVLLLHLPVVLGGAAASVPQPRRHKRDWLIPTQTLKENFEYSRAIYVARIRSDMDEQTNVYYTLLGPGASEPPVNLFVVEDTSGQVYIRGKLDREKRETYILTGVARYINGSGAESRIDLKFEVEDENDNPPVFVPVPPATVKESSPAGTLVGRLTATDADKANCSHSKIAYSIVDQDLADGTKLFSIDRENGYIYLKEENILDREKKSLYTLTIKGTDLDGSPEGNTGTGTILVKVVDINDNIPVLDKDEYSASIVENTANVEVMRFTVLDADEVQTDNWLAVFDIVSGNELGTFSIKTDPKTNEGILMLEKPVDFEETPDIKLGVVVSNVAPFVGDGGGDGDGGGGGEGDGDEEAAGATGAGTSSKKPVKNKKPKKGKAYPVNIIVLNESEGVAFKPAVKPVSVSENPEDNPLMEVITVYPATDTETGKLGENVRYAKGYDPANWLVIDPKTAEIKLQTFPDRESPFVVNGTYYAEILAVAEDGPPRVVTGTIALQVGDVNDNCPSLTDNERHICSDTEVIYITAVDEDGDPNSAPFNFSLGEKESRDKWRLKKLEPPDLNIDTSVHLWPLKPLWPGHYQVGLIIKDKQGFACSQYLDLYVYTCEEGETLPGKPDAAYLKKSSSKFGELGVGALILGLLMLLIVGLLLVACSCAPKKEGVFSDLPFETGQRLIAYHTEGQGEDRNVPLLSTPATMTSAALTTAKVNNAAPKSQTNNMSRPRCLVNSMNQQSSSGESRQSWKDTCSMEDQLEGMVSMAISDAFLDQYYSQKTSYAAEHQAPMDCLRNHAFEGQGSSASSVSSCSLLESDNHLQFLDDLGPKFKTLADVCSPPRPPTPPTHQATAMPKVDEVAHIARPSLGAKPPSIHEKSTECNQNVSISQSSTRSIVLNGTASRSTRRHSSNSTSMAQLPHVSPVTGAIQPSPGHMVILQQQQPVCYTTTPMLQPMHYIVQPQIQSPVLLAEAPVSNMQGTILLNGVSGHREHILHEGNVAGTLTLSRQRSNRVVNKDYGVGTWTRSDGQAEVMDVNRKERHIKSESGDWMENGREVTLSTRHVSEGAAGSEELQQVTQKENKRRTRSTASAEAGFLH